MFLKIKDYKGYDFYYLELLELNNTWKEILGYVESVLDDKWINNCEKLDGIKCGIEIVAEIPEGVELED